MFGFFLARTLGRTYEELLSSISAAEFVMWWRLYLKDPWGEVRSDLRNGVLANIVRGAAGQKPADIPDLNKYILFQKRDTPASGMPTMQQFKEANKR